MEGRIELDEKTAMPRFGPEEEQRPRSSNPLLHPAMSSQGFGVLAIAALILVVALMVLGFLGVRFF